MAKNILKTGRNCWRICHADRVAFLIDGDAYFTALHDALEKARQDIFILSWDIYSEIKLGALKGDQRTLSELFNQQLESHQGLSAHILNWDYAMLFAMSREWLPTYKLGWSSHPRLHFCMDNHHPVSASHHQKVAIVDYQLAFNGGLDLTQGRWDTSEHRPADPRRQQVDNSSGRPYHDIQLAMSGEVALSLHEMARQRWHYAMNEVLPEPEVTGEPYWPDGLTPDLEDVDVAIVRTLPPHEEQKAAHEVEQLYLDAIAAAEDYIYIENQYFTSPTIADALKSRLEEQDGPEIVINMPLQTEGWLAQNSMDVIRVKLFQQLREVDHQCRLAVYYPYTDTAADYPINLHAKVMVLDDRFARVGSSNLNNRSMRLDTECDIALECDAEDERVVQAIAGFRNRLLAEHLHTEPEQVQQAIDEQGSLIKGIESLRGDAQRTLNPLEDALPDFHETLLTEQELVDPEQPIMIDRMVENWIPESEPEKPRRGIYTWLASLIGLAALAAMWRFTPLQEWLDVDRVSNLIQSAHQQPYSELILVVSFILAGLVMVPITLLIIATVIVFGPWLGFAYAMIGSLGCAMAGYALGSFMGRDAISQLSGGRIHAISQKLARRGILTIIILRIVPVAPFTIINLVAGASHIKRNDFMLGSLIGLLPGVAAVSLLANSIASTFLNPTPTNIAILGAIALLIYSIGWVLTRYLLRDQEDGGD